MLSPELEIMNVQVNKLAAEVDKLSEEYRKDPLSFTDFKYKYMQATLKEYNELAEELHLRISLNSSNQDT